MDDEILKKKDYIEMLVDDVSMLLVVLTEKKVRKAALPWSGRDGESLGILINKVVPRYVAELVNRLDDFADKIVEAQESARKNQLQ